MDTASAMIRDESRPQLRTASARPSVRARVILALVVAACAAIIWALAGWGARLLAFVAVAGVALVRVARARRDARWLRE
jgi:Flp pilus assembly protein TadB